MIITLNEEKNIGNLLNDLVAQRYRNFEVVVADSCSGDDTVAIAESYKDRLDLRTVVMGGAAPVWEGIRGRNRLNTSASCFWMPMCAFRRISLKNPSLC
ncbi:glycosyltransferase family A protein [Neisseria dentiae]|uniref:glycosyltransferase family A protein n=1 Tax=Neisseria dentiae TaxID=194197 RepID=UPI00359C1471